MTAFQLAVRLQILWTGPEVGDPHEQDKLIEVMGDELRSVVRDDPGPLVGIFFGGFPQDDFDVPFGHRFS